MAEVLRVLVVDDEIAGRRLACRLLAAEADLQVIGQAANGVEAVEAIRTLRPDVVFLDVQMSGLDGFDVLRAVGAEERPVVVFVTAHDEYAVRAFDVHAIDYVLKPLEEKRFALAVSRARSAVDARRQPGSADELGQRLTALLDTMAHPPTPATRVVVRIGTRSIVLRSDEIDRLEADGNYVRVHTATAGRAFILRESLARLEAQLASHSFLRVHRSTLVNTDRIREVRSVPGGEYEIVLRDGSVCATGPRYRARIEAWLGRAR